jgi:hypothetical protein
MVEPRGLNAYRKIKGVRRITRPNAPFDMPRTFAGAANPREGTCPLQTSANHSSSPPSELGPGIFSYWWNVQMMLGNLTLTGKAAASGRLIAYERAPTRRDRRSHFTQERTLLTTSGRNRQHHRTSSFQRTECSAHRSRSRKSLGLFVSICCPRPLRNKPLQAGDGVFAAATN